MKNIIDKIMNILNLGGLVEVSDFCIPPNLEMGDLCLPCFELAKREGKKPNEVANEILKQVQDDKIIGDSDLIEKIEAVGPYVNIFLNSQVVAELVLEEMNKENF